MKYDYIIIGGGICGLQIASLCSNLGKVLVLEKNSHVGGRARVINKDGFLLDYGGHPVRFGKRSAIAQTMRDIGFEVEFIDPGISYIYLKDGTKNIFPTGIKGILKSKLISKFELIKILLKLMRDYKKNPKKLKETSFETFISNNKISPSMQIFLKSATASMQVNPFLERSSMGEFYLNLIRVMKNKSVFYPRGGWNVFFNNLEEKIKENGDIKCSSKVEEIVVENNTAIGVKVNSETYRGRTIISTIPIQNLFKILDKKYVETQTIHQYENLRCTSGICIDFCLEKKITDDNLVFFEDPPVFGLISSNLSPEISPKEKSIMYFFCPASKENIEDRDEREKLKSRIINFIYKIYPEIEKYQVYQRILFLKMVDGVEIAIDQYEDLRPDGSEIKIKNLFLTGDSIGGEGAGGDVGHTSVRNVYQQILNEYKK